MKKMVVRIITRHNFRNESTVHYVRLPDGIIKAGLDDILSNYINCDGAINGTLERVEEEKVGDYRIEE